MGTFLSTETQGIFIVVGVDAYQQDQAVSNFTSKLIFHQNARPGAALDQHSHVSESSVLITSAQPSSGTHLLRSPRSNLIWGMSLSWALK